MKITAFLFVALITVQVGTYLADLSHAAYDAFINKKVDERIQELKSKGKPAYCSFYQ